MNLHGKNLVAGRLYAAETTTFTAINPTTGQELPPRFYEATGVEVDEAVGAAQEAFETYRRLPAEAIADFLDAVAQAIMALGDELLKRANAETALPESRLISERLRTVN